MSKEGIIYKATNTANGKAYVGKTTKTLGRRRTEHFSVNQQTVYTVFKKALLKYGKQSFTWEILEHCPVELLNEREEFYIRKHGTHMTEGGYNMTYGGDGAPFGELNPSKRPEVKAKLSLKNRNFKHKPETLAIMSAKSKAYYENGMPEGQRQKISDSLRGRKGHGKMKKSYSFVSPEGNIVQVTGIREFARGHGLDHSSLAKLTNGKLKTHKGWRLADSM